MRRRSRQRGACGAVSYGLALVAALALLSPASSRAQTQDGGVAAPPAPEATPGPEALPALPPAQTPPAAPMPAAPGDPPDAAPSPLPELPPAAPKDALEDGDAAADAQASDRADGADGAESYQDADEHEDDDETAAPPPIPIRYFLERVEVRGNQTRAAVIKRYVPIDRGELFDVDDPTIERLRWRLLGTGYFDDVKLSLARGSQKGWVVLVIEVKERNTLVLERLVLGVSRVVPKSTAMDDTLAPYAGLSIAENNLFGLGLGVSAAGVLSKHQYGVNLGYLDPMLFGTGYSLSGRLFYNHAREFFGSNPLFAVACPTLTDPDLEDTCTSERAGKRAVVVYNRAGFGFGTGHDISGQLRYTLDWLGEYVDVVSKPTAASTVRGNEVVPIDFRIEDGSSVVSSLRFGLIYDRRDHPALTTRGTLANFSGRVASGVFGSSYDFVRLEGSVRQWLPLPWHHSLSIGGYLGAVFGEPPFFYAFYAADLSDLLPSRVLELNLDHRRPLNLLGTSIAEMDMEDLAARVDLEYQLPLHRGGGIFRGIDAYAGVGLYVLARRQDLRVAITGYEGAARVPVDLTFDIGVQADTEIGLMRLGFSSFVGFMPDL